MSSHKYILLDFVYCSDGAGKIRKLEQSEFDKGSLEKQIWLLTEPEEMSDFVPENIWGDDQLIVCWTDELPKDMAYFKNDENDKNTYLRQIHKLADFFESKHKSEFLSDLADLTLAFIHRKSVYEDAGKTFTQYFIGLRLFI